MRKKKKKYKARTDTSSKAKKTAVRKAAVARKRAAAPKTRAAGTLSEGEFFQRIRSSLRRAFRFWKPMMIALDRASRPYRGPNKRQKKEYKCNHCGNYFPRTNVQIDHIIECGSLNKWEDVVPFIQRLTVEDISSFQILCKPCHKRKTDAFKASKKVKL